MVRDMTKKKKEKRDKKEENDKIELYVTEPGEEKPPIHKFFTHISDEFEIAGVKIRKGDKIEIAFGRNKVVIGKFIAFDRLVYAISVDIGDDIIIIPYKYIKYIRKFGGMNDENDMS